MSVILVTGATGRHGGTGAHVARRLRDEGHAVRLLVRRRDARSAAFEADGFDVRVGDLRDPASLRPALEGVDQVTFSFPVDAGIVEAAAGLGSALRRSAPSARVVVLSMIVASEASPSHLGRAQWLAEEVLAWAGVERRILRVAALFYENIVLLHGPSIREHGVIRNCFGDARMPWIAGEDAAELMVAALLHPERFGDGPVCSPPGAELHTHAEIADVLTSELGKAVRFEAISPDAWRGDLLALAARGGSAVNQDMAGHISAVGAALSRRGPMKAPDAADLQRQLGRPAISLRRFVRSRIAELT
ncbi:MAG: NAD(P)H-binding protein [Minicystis sp.]